LIFADRILAINQGSSRSLETDCGAGTQSDIYIAID
jgi:hypothetical protein